MNTQAAQRHQHQPLQIIPAKSIPASHISQLIIPLIVTLLWILASGSAWAQNTPPGESDDTQQVPGVLEEIVVRARYREESLQDVPISIAAVSGADIAEARLNTVQELEYSVPNLVFGETGSSGETFIGIRGIGDFSRNIGFDTRVGVYLDGVFAGQSLAVDQGLVDVKQVEVLRGPQGTLFGKNSTAGVLSVVTNAPILGENSGEFRARGGNLDTLFGSGVVNLPVGDTAAMRFAISAQQQDGYIKNLFDNNNLMSNDLLAGRFRFLLQPSDALDVNFSFDFRQQDNNLLFLEPTAQFEDTVGNPLAAPDFIVDQDAELVDDNHSWGTSLTMDYDFGNDFVLTSISGYRTADRKVGSDEDATSTFTLAARYFEDDFQQFTQELRLASPGENRFRYVLGAFYFDQNAKTDRVVALGPGFGGPPQGVDAAVQDSAVDTQSWALFVNGNFDVTDRLTLSAGLRYTDEQKDASIVQNVFPGFGLATHIAESYDRSDSYWTVSTSLEYEINDTVSTYFTYSNGYKSGGFNVDLVPAVEDLPYEEETVDSFEVGMKSDLLDGHLRLNLDVFYAEYSDYQVFQFRFDPSSGTTALLVSNAAQVTTKGFEAEGSALFTDNFSLDFGVGYSDATFDDFPGGAVDGSTGEPVNVAGNVLPRAPKWTGNLTGRYDFSLGEADSSIMVNYTYRGAQYFNPDNRENSHQGGYGLWNAAWNFDINENWGVALYGQNLGDKTYATMRGISFLGVPFSLLAQPRTYGVEVSFRY